VKPAIAQSHKKKHTKEIFPRGTIHKTKMTHGNHSSLRHQHGNDNNRGSSVSRGGGGGQNWLLTAALVALLGLAVDKFLLTPAQNIFLWGFFSGIIFVIAIVGLIGLRLLRFKESPPTQIPTESDSQPAVTTPTPFPPFPSALVPTSDVESCDWLNTVVGCVMKTLNVDELKRIMLTQAAEFDWLRNAKIEAIELGDSPKVIRSIQTFIPTESSNSRHGNHHRPSTSSSNTISFHTNLDVQTSSRLTFSGDLTSNWPSPAIVALPARIHMSNLVCRGMLELCVCSTTRQACVRMNTVPELDFDLVVECGIDYDVQDASRIKAVLKKVISQQLEKKAVVPNFIDFRF
jgi:hypothetical protein